MLTDKQLKEALKKAEAEVVAELKANVKEAMARQLDYTVGEETKKAVAEWFREEIVPDLKAQLTTSKEGILLAVGQFANNIADELAKALLKTAKERLSRSWEVKKIVDALFD